MQYEHQGCLQDLTSWGGLWGGTYLLVCNNGQIGKLYGGPSFLLSQGTFFLTHHSALTAQCTNPLFTCFAEADSAW